MMYVPEQSIVYNFYLSYLHSIFVRIIRSSQDLHKSKIYFSADSRKIQCNKCLIKSKNKLISNGERQIRRHV